MWLDPKVGVAINAASVKATHCCKMPGFLFISLPFFDGGLFGIPIRVG